MDAKTVDIPDPLYKDAAPYIIGVGSAWIGWIWRQVSSRATKAELSDAVKSLKDQNAAALSRLEEHRREAKDSAERIYDKLDEMGKSVVTLAVEVGKLQGESHKNGRNVS